MAVCICMIYSILIHYFLYSSRYEPLKGLVLEARLVWWRLSGVE